MKTRKEKLNRIILFSFNTLRVLFLQLWYLILLVTFCIFRCIELLLITIYYPFYYVIYNGDCSLIELIVFVDTIFPYFDILYQNIVSAIDKI